MSEKMISLLAACAVTAAGLAIAAPAVAKQQPVVVTAISEDIPIRYVSYRDLNLARAEGEKTLVRRVGFAVKDVCAESVGDASPRELPIRTQMMGCRDQSFARARPQIDRAVQRAKEIALNGWSSIAPVAITISVP